MENVTKKTGRKKGGGWNAQRKQDFFAMKVARRKARELEVSKKSKGFDARHKAIQKGFKPPAPPTSPTIAPSGIMPTVPQVKATEIKDGNLDKVMKGLAGNTSQDSITPEQKEIVLASLQAHLEKEKLKKEEEEI